MVSILKQAKADKKELTKEVEKMNAVFDEHNAKIKSLERTKDQGEDQQGGGISGREVVRGTRQTDEDQV